MLASSWVPVLLQIYGDDTVGRTLYDIMNGLNDSKVIVNWRFRKSRVWCVYTAVSLFIFWLNEWTCILMQWSLFLVWWLNNRRKLSGRLPTTHWRSQCPKYLHVQKKQAMSRRCSMFFFGFNGVEHFESELWVLYKRFSTVTRSFVKADRRCGDTALGSSITSMLQFASFVSKIRRLFSPASLLSRSGSQWFLFDKFKSVLEGRRLDTIDDLKTNSLIARHFKRSFPGLLWEAEILLGKVCDYGRRIFWRGQVKNE